MQTMPGLPRQPRGEMVDIDAEGHIRGLSSAFAGDHGL